MNKKIKVLVVEDDLSIQEEIEDVLAALGYDHDWATTQQEARELIEKNHYDCVLADLEIPARPGRGFAKIEYRPYLSLRDQIKVFANGGCGRDISLQSESRMFFGRCVQNKPA